MSRWGSHEAEIEEFDFSKIISETNNAAQLLQCSKFLEQAKNNRSKFTIKIIEEMHRLKFYEIIDIAFNPLQYAQHKKISLNTKITFSAIELLTNLSEEFQQCVFDEGEEKQDEVVQTMPTLHPIMEYIVRILDNQKLQETGLSYFAKMMTPFIYQRGAKMLEIFTGQFGLSFLKHFANQSICELLTKALEAESENDFFEESKLKLFDMIATRVKQETNQSQLVGRIESFSNYLEGLVEKHQDKYEKGKYSGLLKKIVQKKDNFQFLIKTMEQHWTNHSLKSHSLHCIEAYLRIHLPSIQSSKISNSKSLQNIKPPVLNESFNNVLRGFLVSHSVREFMSQDRLQLLNYYKVIKVAFIVKPQLINPILTKQFIAETFKLMQSDQGNNILHNFQKDVLIEGIRQSPQVYVLIKNQIGFQQILRSNLTDKVSTKSYQSQLFLIGQSIKTKTQELNQHFSTSWSDLEQTIKQKRNFYSVIIGGDPRNSAQEKWDNFDSEVVEEKIEKDGIKEHKKLLSNKYPFSCTPKLDELGGAEVLSQDDDDIGEQVKKKNEHYFDFELPLDSDKEEEKDNGHLKLLGSQNQKQIFIKVYSLNDDIQTFFAPTHTQPSLTTLLQQNPKQSQLHKPNHQLSAEIRHKLFTKQVEQPRATLMNSAVEMDIPIQLLKSNSNYSHESLTSSIVNIQISQPLTDLSDEATAKIQIQTNLTFTKSQDKVELIDSKDKEQQIKIVQAIQMTQTITAVNIPAKDQIQTSLQYKYGTSLIQK